MKPKYLLACLFLLGIGHDVTKIMGALKYGLTLLRQYEPTLVHNSLALPGRSRRL